MLIVPLLEFVLVVAALVDIITRTDSQVKHLPKIVWILLVVFLPLVGGILWFAIGHEYAGASAQTSRGGFGESWRRPAPATARATTSVRRELTTEEQLAALDREIEFHEKQAEIKRLEAKLNEKNNPPE
jgi:hypothetical protein